MMTAIAVWSLMWSTTCGLAQQAPTNASTQANSQDEQSIISQPARDSGSFEFDYGVPSSPALAVAGLTNDKIPTSSSLKSFVLSLPSVLGPNSSGQAVALDLDPAYFLQSPLSLNAGNYQDADFWERIWVRTHLGGVISDGSNGNGDATKASGSKLAFSLSTSLLDSNDPLMGNGWGAQIKCFSDPGNKPKLKEYESFKSNVTDTINEIDNARPAIDAALNSTHSTSLVGRSRDLVEKAITDAFNAVREGDELSPQDKAYSPDLSLADEQRMLVDYDTRLQAIRSTQESQKAQSLGIESILESCAKEGTTAAANSAALDLGLGMAWTGKDGAVEDFATPNGAGWLGFRVPITDLLNGGSVSANGSQRNSAWVVGGSARYDYQTMVDTGNKNTPKIEANVADAWVGAEYDGNVSLMGGGRSIKLDAQYGYLDQRAVDSGDSSFSESGSRWLMSGSFELLPSQGVWLQASYGNAQGTTAKLNDHTFMLSLNFGPPKASSIFGSPNNNSDTNSKSNAARFPGTNLGGN